MVQGGDRTDFALEAIAETLRRQLDSHVASHARIVGPDVSPGLKQPQFPRF